MKKNTLTKLVALATVLLVSVGTIAGSTVAWFTDTEYAINTIQSGSLDIGLQYMTKAMFNNTSETDFDKKWENVDPAKQMFNKDALYEPGYTEVVFLKVANIGDLDLKYKLAVQAADTQTGESLIVDTAEGEGDKVLELSDYLKMAAFKVTATDDSSISEQVSDLFTDTAADAATGTAAQSARAKARAKINDTQASTTDGDKILYLSKGEKVTDTEGNEVAHITGKGPIYKVDMFTETKTDDDGTTTTVPATYRLLAEKKDADGTIAIPAGEEVIGLVLYMPEEVGNEANNRGTNKPQIELGIFLEAAQLTSESDSYGSDYDENASFASTNLNSVDRTTSSGATEVTTVSSYEELKAAVESSKTNIQVVKEIKYPSGGTIAVPESASITLDLNGNVVDGTAANASMFTLANSTLKITDNSNAGSGEIAFASFGTNRAVTVNEDGVLEVEKGSLTGFAVQAQQGTVKISGGSVENCYVGNDDTPGTLEITGGKVGTITAIRGSLTMTDGEVGSLSADAVSVEMTINISGGKITGEFVIGYNTTVTIKGGTFSGSISNYAGGTLNISGGNFQVGASFGTDTFALNGNLQNATAAISDGYWVVTPTNDSDTTEPSA